MSFINAAAKATLLSLGNDDVNRDLSKLRDLRGAFWPDEETQVMRVWHQQSTWDKPKPDTRTEAEKRKSVFNLHCLYLSVAPCYQVNPPGTNKTR